MRRSPREPRKGLDQDILGLPEPGGSSGSAGKGLARIWTTQGSMLMDTKNKDRHVPSAAHDSEKS